MSDHVPTFVFENDRVLAFHEGSVIAQGKESDFALVEKSALEYMDEINRITKAASLEEKKKRSSHIITPNGVEGEILGRTRGQWGDEEVTVRLANGTITHLQIHASTEDKWDWVDKTKTSGTSKVAQLSEVLDADYAHDRASLTARASTLKDLAQKAAQLIVAGVSSDDETKLDEIKLAADCEVREISDVLASLDADDIEPYAAPEFAAVRQASMGRAANDSWLDRIAQDMIAEADAQDFDAILRDGPALFVSELDTGALADTSVTREMALSHVASKTAGYKGDDVNSYHDQWVARVEVARRAELASRKETTKREASARRETEVDAPDESLFI